MEHSQHQFVTNQSMAANIASAATEINLFYGYAVQADYTGSSLGGVLAIQGSVDHRQDPSGNVLNAGNFVTITDSPVTISGAGSYIWNIRESNYSYFRLIYTAAMSDSGTLNAYSTIKGV